MYTKGKWEVDGEDELLIMGGNTCVAKIVKTYYPESQEANARLIAAAPDMYEALKIAVGVFAALDTKTSNEVADICRQALAKTKEVNNDKETI